MGGAVFDNKGIDQGGQAIARSCFGGKGGKSGHACCAAISIQLSAINQKREAECC